MFNLNRHERDAQMDYFGDVALDILDKRIMEHKEEGNTVAALEVRLCFDVACDVEYRLTH